MLAVSAAPQNSVQAQKHIVPSGVQLPFRDVRVLNIQGRTYISTCHSMGCYNHKSTCIVRICYVCMYVSTSRYSDIYLGMSSIQNGSSYLR